MSLQTRFKGLSSLQVAQTVTWPIAEDLESDVYNSVKYLVSTHVVPPYSMPPAHCVREAWPTRGVDKLR